MKHTFLYIIFTIALISSMSCKTSKTVFNPETTDNDFLTFGTGGGFTGKVVKYFLVSDGTVYTDNGTEIVKVGKAPKQLTDQLFFNYDKLGLNHMRLHEPGNKYSFIHIKKDDHTNAMTWGKRPLENKNVETYFTILMSIVKKLRPSETL